MVLGAHRPPVAANPIQAKRTLPKDGRVTLRKSVALRYPYGALTNAMKARSSRIPQIWNARTTEPVHAEKEV